MPRILALDLATNIGAAVDRLPGNSAPGPYITGYRLDKQGEAFGPGYLQLRNWLRLMISTYRPHTVVFEAPWVRTTGDAKDFRGRKPLRDAQFLFGIVAVTELVVAECPTLGHPFKATPQTVRKHFVGHGFPDDPKKAVFERCLALGWHPSNYDQSDAAALWSCAKASLDPDYTLEAQAGPLFFNGGEGNAKSN